MYNHEERNEKNVISYKPLSNSHLIEFMYFAHFGWIECFFSFHSLCLMLFPSAQTLNINAWTLNFLSSFNFKVKFYHKNRTILSLISWKIRKFATLFRPKFFYHNESKEIINKEIYLTSEHLDPASGNFRSDALILSL